MLTGLFQSTPSSQKVTVIDRMLPDVDLFQSTPSSQKVTFAQPCFMITFYISIHTFLTEGD